MKSLVKSFSAEQLEVFKAFLEAGSKIDLQEMGNQDQKDKVELSEEEKEEKAFAEWKELMQNGGEM